MTLAERIAAFATEPDLDAPEDARRAAALHALDAVGCGLAARALGVADAARSAMEAEGGAGPSTAIGVQRGLAPLNAALANGMLCHALDFDDTHAAAIAHVSAVVAPAAMAAAEAQGRTGAELLDAIVVGGEVTIALGVRAASGLYARGFHPTSVAGVFGATAAAARLGGLDAETTTRALGIAASTASGLLAYLNDGAQTKPFHAGWAAHAGVVAARLAAHGAEGPPSAIEGRFGVFPALADVHDADADLPLGRVWRVPELAIKPYPCCHFSHGCLAAGEALLADGLDPADIDEIAVAVPAEGVALVLEPAAHKAAPRTRYEAQFSLPWSLAALFLTGRLDLGTYSPDVLADPAIRALAARVTYEVADFASYPGAFPGKVRAGGRELVVEHQPGSLGAPLGDDTVVAKFRANAALALDDPAAVEQAFLGLDEVADLPAALAPLRAAQPARVVRSRVAT
jgi:2-methylcitrate dehydratase PrpD